MVGSKIFNHKEFYSRQIVLPELKLEGQERLRRSKVAVVGLGGLGTISALYLALAGVGHLRLIDQDTVELSNLHRQVLYGLKSLRYPKVEAAAERIKQMNPEVKAESIPENVRETNVDDLIRGMSCVVDGLDNMRTRYLLNRACASQKIPYVFGGAIGIEGNLSVFAPPETPCLECVLPDLDDRYLPTCDVRGVLGATPGIIGSMQAMETIKLLAGIGDSLKGKLMVCDFRDMLFTTIEIFKRSDCQVCQDKPARPVQSSERLAWLCGHNTVNVNLPRSIEVSLDEIYEKLRHHFRIIMKSSLVIVFEYDGSEVSLFMRGRMLIKNVENEETALKVCNNVLEKLDISFA